MKRTSAIVLGVVAVAMATSGCFGSFNLTRKLYNWNGQVSKDKWVVEGVFLVCAWAPIYALAGLGDAIIFNSMEFWQGKNPIEMSGTDGSKMRRLVRDDAEVRLTRLTGSTGEQLLIEQFQHGTAAASLRIERDGERTVGRDAEGRVVLSAMTLPDGTVLVSDVNGQPVGTYSAQDLRHLAQAAPSQ